MVARPTDLFGREPRLVDLERRSRIRVAAFVWSPGVARTP
jgi:hypothetical protein